MVTQKIKYVRGTVSNKRRVSKCNYTEEMGCFYQNPCFIALVLSAIVSAFFSLPVGVALGVGSVLGWILLMDHTSRKRKEEEEEEDAVQISDLIAGEEKGRPSRPSSCRRSSSSPSSYRAGRRSAMVAATDGGANKEEVDGDKKKAAAPPPPPPSNMHSAFRELTFVEKEVDPLLGKGTMQEGPLDDLLHKERFKRGREPDMKALYTTHMGKLLDSYQEENLTVDPHIVPANGAAPGRKRCLGVV